MGQQLSRDILQPLVHALGWGSIAELQAPFPSEILKTQIFLDVLI
jgi:hypothetical protein